MIDPSLILTLDKVAYRFPDGSYAFEDLSLEVKRGEIISLLGPSGAGKTSLVNVLAGLRTPSAGRIEYHYRRSALVFQGYGVFPWLTALENAAFGLRMAGLPRSKYFKIAREKLTEVGLAGLENRYPHELSGGQRQRVAIARALAVEPDFLIMDEPFSSLDTLTANHLRRDLLALWRRYGLTLIIVNHLIPDAVELSDRVVIMASRPGRLKTILPIDLNRPRDMRAAASFALVDKLIGELEETSQK